MKNLNRAIILRMAFDSYEEEGANYIQHYLVHIQSLCCRGLLYLRKLLFFSFLLLMALSQMILLLQDVLCAKNHKLY